MNAQIPVTVLAPPVPPEIQALSPRKIPSWGPTIGSVAMFVIVWAVFSAAPTYGFFWALFNDPTSIFLPLGGILGVPLTIVVLVVIVRMFRNRAVIRAGALAVCPISDMVYTKRVTSRGIEAVRFRYTLIVDGKKLVRTGQVRGIEMRKLPDLPKNSDYAIVAYLPDAPRRNQLFGFVYRDGRSFAPGLR